MTNDAKKVSLLERMNSGMAAIELPPGTLVRYVGHLRTDDIFFKTRSDAMGTLRPIDMPNKQILMYLGIVELGPSNPQQFKLSNYVVPGTRQLKKRLPLSAGKFFAHRFYYLGEMVYLVIDRPDKYYTVFRTNIKRVDNKNNLCR